MSFMFNPYPYDDLTAVNTPVYTEEEDDILVEGTLNVARTLAEAALDKLAVQQQVVLAVDGYVSAQFDQLVRLIRRNLTCPTEAIDVSGCYKTRDALAQQFAPFLPDDKTVDPPLLYGKLFKGGAEAYIDQNHIRQCISRLDGGSDSKVVILYGCFAGISELRQHVDILAYIDVIPKNVVLNLKHGKAGNIGDTSSRRDYRSLMRRAYYCDFEAAGDLRTQLLQGGELDYYITGNDPDNMQLLSWSLCKKVCDALVHQPLRCKPVYNEGVWGGYYTKHRRNLPAEMKNCAWVFDLIPSEVSLLVDIRSSLVDIPFYTFLRIKSEDILGEYSLHRFGQYFPVRFNYDDTMHSSGNMSIQIHPGEEFCREHYHELGRQDESYYVVTTGLNGKTYCGLKEHADADEFFERVREAEEHGTAFNYDDYVNSVPTRAGMQFMLPAGTIHSSGRNQLILEIGSLTVGSYTFKLYDYMRKDLDGTLRPIHSVYGEQVLDRTRRTDWVEKRLIKEPICIASGENWSEQIIGEIEEIYFSLRLLEFDREISQDTQGRFHVLALVDGECVEVVSEADPRYSFEMKYLDILVVPACIGPYRIVNKGDHPAAVHKTLLR